MAMGFAGAWNGYRYSTGYRRGVLLWGPLMLDPPFPGPILRKLIPWGLIGLVLRGLVLGV